MSRVLFTAALLGAAPVFSSGPPPALYESPPRGTPSSSWPDGPFLGNGVTGAVIGGAPGSITLYFALSGFWSTGYGSNSSMPPMDTGSPLNSSFPGCPAPDCMITVGMTLGTVEISSSFVTSSWTAQFNLAGANATVDLTDGTHAHGLRLTAYVSATSPLTVIDVLNTGTAALPFNISTAGNGNPQNVPVRSGCVNKAGAAASCPPPGRTLPGHWLTKDADAPGTGTLNITAAFAFRVISADGVSVGVTAPFNTTVPHTPWSGGPSVATLTSGTTTAAQLAPAGGFTLALSAFSSNDPGVAPQSPLSAALLNIGNTSVAQLPALADAHQSWWTDYFSRSSVTLDPEYAGSVEAFWWTAVYALGAGSRAGGVTMDLWSPWRTTDYSLWRSNPTMDYNQQALYSGAVTANHAEIIQPYWQFIQDAVATGGPQLEAASLGCPHGVHLSVDLAPFGLKMGVFGEVQAWSIRSNAAYAAVLHAYYWAAMPHDDPDVLEWVTTYAYPFLTKVAAFWQCYLTKTPVSDAPDGYLYYGLVDCDGDEGCDPQGNAVWSIVYLARVLDTLISIAEETGRTASPAWADIRGHLPPIPVWIYNGNLVLADYGLCTATNAPCNTESWSKQSGYLHSIWPGEMLSMSEPNATLLAAANNTFTLTSWTQDNSFSWVYASAARIGWPPADTLSRFKSALSTGAGGGLNRTNRLVAFGGLCSDSLGAMAYVHDMMVQGHEGFVRVFPAWPADHDAAFTSLRVRGALLVSAAYIGRAEWVGDVAGLTGGTANVTVASQASGNVTLLNPWTARTVVVRDAETGAAQPLTWGSVGGVNGGPTLTWAALKGHTYVATVN